MEWISVNVKLPEESSYLLVTNCRKSSAIFIAYYNPMNACFTWIKPELEENIPLDITHWIAIPKTPNPQGEYGNRTD